MTRIAFQKDSALPSFLKLMQLCSIEQLPTFAKYSLPEQKKQMENNPEALKATRKKRWDNPLQHVMQSVRSQDPEIIAKLHAGRNAYYANPDNIKRT